MSSGRDRRCSPSGTADTRVQSPDEVRDQIERVLPGHVGILQPVQDVHGPAGIERLGADQVPAAVLDEGARDGIGAVAVVGGAQIDALLLDVPAGAGGQICSHISSVMSQAGAISTSALDARGFLRRFGHQRAQQQKRDVAAHAGADEDLRALR